MTREDMLARLIAQASTEGGELVTLRAIVEEASEIGATRVLDRLGLSDAHAQDDIDELRELLKAWRDAKASAWKAARAQDHEYLELELLVSFANCMDEIRECSIANNAEIAESISLQAPGDD